MGYRSEVQAAFYASKPEDIAKIKAWFQLRKSEYLADERKKSAACWLLSDRADNMDEYGWEEHERGYVFVATGVKWYEDFDEVKLFNEISQDFCEVFIEGVENSPYAYEFVRIGEDINDIVEEIHGNTEWVLRVERSISCEL